jgi:hypothetical protein
VYEPGVLSRTHVGHVIVAAWKDEVVQRAAPPLQPCAHRLPSRVHEFELNRPLGFLLNDEGTVTDTPACDDISNSYPDNITAAQLAIDRKIEQRSVAQSPMLIKPEAYGPDLLLFERALRADQSTLIPGSVFVKRGVHR